MNSPKRGLSDGSLCIQGRCSWAPRLPFSIRAYPNRTARCSRSLLEPVNDASTQYALRLSAHEHADVTARQTNLAVIVGSHALAKRARTLRRNDVILLGVHVEHRHCDIGELDLASAELELVLDQLVLLIQ